MIPPAAGGELRAAVRDAAQAAARDARPHWVAFCARGSARDALEVFRNARDEERFYWERPERGRSIAAVGAVHAIEARGPARFRDAARGCREVFRNLHRAGETGPPQSGPLLVGGFAFAENPAATPSWRDFPPCRLVLPEVLCRCEGDRAWFSVARRIPPAADVDREAAALADGIRAIRAEPAGALEAPGARGPARGRGREAAVPEYLARADRTHADYRARVEAALCDIAAGEIEKVVLARSIRLICGEVLDAGALLDTLRHSYRSCTHFAVARPGGVFLGATPEHLVHLEEGRVETAAVAGSAPRGRNPEEDERLGRELCESKKEQAEHAVVVRALREALADCCEDLDVPEAPRLLRLGEIQHLETRISGMLRNGKSILELLARMHPTPAVGGAPRQAALEWIARSENLDRGWYAGPVGFVDAAGGGEFCVALRSALLRGREARLFAGAGIVDGSVPEAELRETRLKLRALLAPLLEI